MAKKQMQKQAQPQQSSGMTLEEAKAFRASLAKTTTKPLNQKQKRDAFKVYWTQNKKKYGMTGKLEHVLWLHLVATQNDSPANFEAGLKNFGIKKV
jgi:hypothetical protein